MTTCKISKIVFNDKAEIEVSPNDIVVFVGPNNVGKSRTLTDIYNLYSFSENNIVIKDIALNYTEVATVESFIAEHSDKQKQNDSIYYNGYNYSIYAPSLKNFGTKPKLTDSIRGFFVSKMNTEDRLLQSDPIAVIDRT